MEMEAGKEYDFTLNRTSGTGNLTMRLVEFKSTTENVLKTSSEITYPFKLRYTPSISDNSERRFVKY